VNSDQPSTPQGEIPSTSLRALAWGAVLIVSVPQLVYRLFVPVVPGEAIYSTWLASVQALVLTACWVVTWVWPPVKSLRGFVLATLAICVGMFLINPLVDETAVWRNWWHQAAWGVALVVGRLKVNLVMIALLALSLIGSGIGRRELFLARGSPNAPAEPTRLLLLKEPTPWNRIIRSFLPFYLIITLIVMGIQVSPISRRFSQIWIYLPAIVLAAAINAFGEEFAFRSMPLVRLEPVFGPGLAVILSAVMFGLVHYFGQPGGPFGALLAGYLGWIAAKSMVETRGFVWAFLIHFLGDLIIYCFWAMLA
jgi:membrane protease YdiL (CAAX protease family)